MPIVEHKKNQSLRFSYLYAIFACCMTGFTQDFFTPFLLFLGGTASQVGLMNSFNNVFSSTMQVVSADVPHKLRSRKRVISLSVILQGVTLLIILALALFHQVNPWIFILIVVLFTTFGAFILPSWVSLLSDMVEHHRRGTYFGWRSRNMGFIIVGTTLIAGLILYAWAGVNKAAGFVIIFAVALVCRIVSWLYLKKMSEPALAFDRSDYFTFWQFIKRHKESNFVHFVVYVAAINFAVNLAAPFFAVLMLKDLKFNYLLFSVVNIIAPLTLYAMIHRWGQHADQVGNIRIIKTVAPFFGCIPLLWIVNQNPLFLLPVEMFSGFMWAGFNLCTSNFVMDAASPGKRARCLAYFSLINGIALAAGALVGGLLIPFLPPLLHSKILTLFAISAALRFAAGCLLSHNIKEVREVKDVSGGQLLLSMIGLPERLDHFDVTLS